MILLASNKGDLSLEGPSNEFVQFTRHLESTLSVLKSRRQTTYDNEIRIEHDCFLGKRPHRATDYCKRRLHFQCTRETNRRNTLTPRCNSRGLTEHFVPPFPRDLLALCR